MNSLIDALSSKGVHKIILGLINNAASIKNPIQLGAFAVAAVVILIIFVAGRANIASILSTGGMGVCIILFAQIVPLATLISDDRLKVQLILFLFCLFVIVFGALTYVAIGAVSVNIVDLKDRTRSHLAQGRCVDGLRTATELSKIAADLPESFNYKGWAEYCLEKYGDAQTDFRKAVELAKSRTGTPTYIFQFNLASALIKNDVVRFRGGGELRHIGEAINLLKDVESSYNAASAADNAGSAKDSDTITNLAIANVMDLNCIDALKYSQMLEVRREKHDVTTAVGISCAVISKGKTVESAKAESKELSWIFSADNPPDRKDDFLVPLQIGYLRYQKMKSGLNGTLVSGSNSYAQVCCKDFGTK